MRIGGSLWSVPPKHVRSEAVRLAEAGLQVWHWDRADGTMGPAGGFTADFAHDIAQATGVRSEAHLMLADPRSELDAWTAFCELVVVHIESPHWRESIERIALSGARGGVAISPGSALPADLPHDIAVLVMTVAPGNAGTSFLEDRLSLLDGVVGHPLRGIDGSVNHRRGQAARAHSANWIVSGTALTSAEDPRAWLASFVENGDGTRTTL
nr:MULTISPECIES: hypothetical protein [Microbacterium]